MYIYIYIYISFYFYFIYLFYFYLFYFIYLFLFGGLFIYLIILPVGGSNVPQRHTDCRKLKEEEEEGLCKSTFVLVAHPRPCSCCRRRRSEKKRGTNTFLGLYAFSVSVGAMRVKLHCTSYL